MHLSAAIPILRIFAEDKAREFYLDFLGFTLEWEHRFEKNFPVQDQPWGRVMAVADPFGNRIRFSESPGHS